MGKHYREYNVTDLGMGLNKFHSLDKIPEGMMSELQNMDPLSNGQVVTRKGFEQYYGCLPLRANAISKNGTKFQIEFDTAVSIDLSEAFIGPIVVAGDLPADSDLTGNGNFFTEYRAHWYDSFNLTFREDFEVTAGSGSKTKSANQTGLVQDQVFVGWYEANSLDNTSNTLLIPEDVTVNKSDLGTTITYEAPEDITGYFTYLPVPDEAGTVFSKEFTVGVGPSDYNLSIPSLEHGLSNTSIVFRMYEDTGTHWKEVYPSEAEIDNTGQIDFYMDRPDSGTIDFKVILYAVDVANTYVTSSVTTPIVIPNVSDPFNFWELWVTSGTTRFNVTPESIEWDATTQEATIEYIAPEVAETVEVYWLPSSFIANTIEFEDNGNNNGGVPESEDFNIFEPEITVWGICHSGIYKPEAVKGGFVNHIDNYKAENEEKLISAINGNLVQATSYEVGANTYLMDSLTVRGSNRVSGTQNIGPLFTHSSDTDERDRGDVRDESVNDDGYATITEVEHPATSRSVYTFTFTGKTGDPIVVGNQLSVNDYLTVRNCSRDVNNGTFKVVSIDYDDAFSTEIQVVNESITSELLTYDPPGESGISAEGNVFTDEVTVATVPVFIEGDKISSSIISGNTVRSTTESPNNLYIDGITQFTVIPDGINLFISRTSGVLPLQFSSTPTVGDDDRGAGLVIGDSLRVTGLNNKPKIVSINTRPDTAVTVNVSSNVATIDLGVDHSYNVNQRLVLFATNNSDLEGDLTITTVPTTSSFSFATDTADGAYTATLLGHCIHIDEDLNYVTGPAQLSVTVDGRWTVVENPKSGQSKVLETKKQHWDEDEVTDQNYMRSVVVNDSMFFVNDKDEHKKFDGSTVVNAGLPPWQSTFFASVDNDTQSFPSGTPNLYDNVDIRSKAFVTSAAVMHIGDRFKSESSGLIYTVADITEREDGNKNIVTEEDWDTGSSGTFVDGDITAGTDNISFAGHGLTTGDVITITNNGNPTSSTVPEGLDRRNTYYAIRVDDNNFKVAQSYSNALAEVPLDIDISGSADTFLFTQYTEEATGTLRRSNQVRYYARLNVQDVNRNIIASATLGSDDMYVEFFTSCAIDIKLAGLPAFAELDHDRIELELYRTKLNRITDFYRVYRTLVNYEDLGGYITIKDSIPDSYLGDPDKDPAVDRANSFGNQWTNPPLGNSLTTVDNRLVVANIKSPPVMDVVFRKKNTELDLQEADFTDVEVQLQVAGVIPSFESSNNTAIFSFHDSGNSIAGLTLGVDSVDVDAGSAHGLSIGDWIYLYHSVPGEDNKINFAGWYRVDAISGTLDAEEVFTIAAEHDLVSVTGQVDSWLTSTTPGPYRVPVFIGNDGNINQRFANDSDVETKVSTRLGMAINAIMSADNPSNGYWNGVRPTPWILSQSGQSFSVGAMQIQLMDAPSGTLNFQWAKVGGDLDFQIFINGNNLPKDTVGQSEIRLFNSRLVSSYPNSPELFDAPYTYDPLTSDSVIDVNPADGQEITAIIPFFGQSAFGAANLTQAVVVFKTNSIYLVDVQSRQTQKLQSQGQGCTAPRSVAATKDGIIFANDSGIYRLGWDMRISWVGRMLHKLWDDEVSVDRIAEFAGHNYRQERKYKLSVVSSDKSFPDNVVVYDHTRGQGSQAGSWTEYTNHPATGWANQLTNSFFGAQTGQVFQVRNAGDNTDFRDDAGPVDNQLLITGGMHYGLPGNRKTTNGVTIQYQNESLITDVRLSTEQSISGVFLDSEVVNISKENANVRYSLAERKGTYLRVKLAKSGTKDEQLQLSQMTFHTKDIGDGGTTEATDLS